MNKMYIEHVAGVGVAVGASLEGKSLHLSSMTQIDGITTVVGNKLIHLEDRAIYDALISLGWVPPKSMEFMSEEWWEEMNRIRVKGMYL